MTSLASKLRLPLVMLTTLVLFAGCGNDSDSKKKNKNDEKKAPSERVAILRERFDQLESSLDEMDRDLEILEARIVQTRQTAKAIRRSLVQGNLKGYSIDTLTTPVIVQQQETVKNKQEKASKQEKKKEAENSFLNAILLIIVFAFLGLIFWVALRDRNQDTPPYTPGTPYSSGSEEEPMETNDEPEAPGTYGEIGGSSQGTDEASRPTDENHPGGHHS